LLKRIFVLEKKKSTKGGRIFLNEGFKYYRDLEIVMVKMEG
jgi:hypothetical protein